MGLIERLTDIVMSEAVRGEMATIVAFDPATASYTITYKGLSVGPVWSVNGVRHAVGKSVTALVQKNLVIGILP